MSYHVETTARFDKEFKSWTNTRSKSSNPGLGKICKIAKILELMERDLPRTKVDNGGIESEIIAYFVLYKIRS